MRYNDFKLGYVGRKPHPEFNESIKEDHFVSLAEQCIMIMCFDDDEPSFSVGDANKIVWIPRENFIPFLIEIHSIRQLYEKLYLEALAS